MDLELRAVIHGYEGFCSLRGGLYLAEAPI